MCSIHPFVYIVNSFLRKGLRRHVSLPRPDSVFTDKIAVHSGIYSCQCSASSAVLPRLAKAIFCRMQPQKTAVPAHCLHRRALHVGQCARHVLLSGDGQGHAGDNPCRLPPGRAQHTNAVFNELAGGAVRHDPGTAYHRSGNAAIHARNVFLYHLQLSEKPRKRASAFFMTLQR